MASADPTVIDEFLLDYTLAINSGFGFIEGDIQFLASVMITISLVMAGLFWALKGEDVMVPFLKKVLLIGFFAFLINNWTDLMGVISNSFVDLGIKAGGNTISTDVFFSPAAIASMGMEFWKYFGQTMNQLTGPIAFFENIVPLSVLFLTGMIVLAAFFVMALQVFVTLVMFKLVTLAAFVLVPFGLLKHTNFMSERALGLVVSYGLKFLTLALIISIGYSVFNELQPIVPISISEAFSICLAALALMMLAMHAPAVASELITGGPQLGAGAMGASIAGSTAIAAGSMYLGAKAASGVGKLAANPLIKAANAGQISINGQPLSSKNSSTSLNMPSGSTGAATSKEGLSKSPKAGGSQPQSGSGDKGGSTSSKGTDKAGSVSSKTSSGSGKAASGDGSSKASKGGDTQKIPTFHQQSQTGASDSGGKEANKKSGIGKGAVAGSAATSSMARSDSSGGISSTGSSNQDEGE